MKNTKKKKVKAKKVVVVKQQKIPDTYFRVDMECSDLDRTSGEMRYWYMEYYPGRSGTTDEAMAHSVVAYLKRIGQGGRLLELDGTPDGKVLEVWAGIGRLIQVEIEEGKKDGNYIVG